MPHAGAAGPDDGDAPVAARPGAAAGDAPVVPRPGAVTGAPEDQDASEWSGDRAGLRPVTAGTLVFLTSAAVLVLEILAARLLAPYVGVSLETYTGIIGTILAAIALGAWLGGRLADRVDPRVLLGPELVLGGGLALAIVPIVRLVGSLPLGAGPAAILLLALVGFFAPAAVLSAVPPTVVKLQLADLARTGSTVGRLSAIGTTGAIVGTFATGFILVAAMPTTPIILSVAVGLIVLGVVVTATIGRTRSGAVSGRALAAVLIGTLPAGALVVLVDRSTDPCDRESAYFCARVVADLPPCIGGLTLYLDTVLHSCVVPGRPEELVFTYAQSVGDVIAEVAPGGAPVRALHIGGGGFTMPRYLQAENPGSTSLVLELDPTLVEIAEQELGLVISPELQVRTGDARTGIGEVDGDGYDLVIGDAFGGFAVPWHLTTAEFVREVDRVLTPDGTYVVNLIDRPPLRFARAETATMASVFEYVAILGPADRLAGDIGGNFIIVGSHAPIDVGAIEAHIRSRGDTDVVLAGDRVTAFIDGADPLTDDYAPVDQLLAPVR